MLLEAVGMWDWLSPLWRIKGTTPPAPHTLQLSLSANATLPLSKSLIITVSPVAYFRNKNEYK